MIPVYVASSDRFAEVEWLTPFSIRENTSAEVVVYVVRPQWYGMVEHGCTGFTNVRFAVPQLLREHGHEFGIYLDVDMLVLGDIADLFSYRQSGKWVALEDGSSEVAVIHRDVQYPKKQYIPYRHKGTFQKSEWVRKIPREWNVEDRVEEGMKLLHFTDLNTQPWFHRHPVRDAVAIYESYRDRYRSFVDSGGSLSDTGVIAA